MGESWIAIMIGGFVLAVAAIAVIDHYRRERRRAELLRNLNHHEWYRWPRSRH